MPEEQKKEPRFVPRAELILKAESHLKAFQGIQPDAYAGFLDRILLAGPNKILCISLKICLDGVCAG